MTRGKINYTSLIERLYREKVMLEEERMKREEAFSRLVKEAKREMGQYEENEYGIECP